MKQRNAVVLSLALTLILALAAFGIRAAFIDPTPTAGESVQATQQVELPANPAQERSDDDHDTDRDTDHHDDDDDHENWSTLLQREHNNDDHDD